MNQLRQYLSQIKPPSRVSTALEVIRDENKKTLIRIKSLPIKVIAIWTIALSTLMGVEIIYFFSLSPLLLVLVAVVALGFWQSIIFLEKQRKLLGAYSIIEKGYLKVNNKTINLDEINQLYEVYCKGAISVKYPYFRIIIVKSNNSYLPIAWQLVNSVGDSQRLKPKISEFEQIFKLTAKKIVMNDFRL